MPKTLTPIAPVPGTNRQGESAPRVIKGAKPATASPVSGAKSGTGHVTTRQNSSRANDQTHFEVVGPTLPSAVARLAERLGPEAFVVLGSIALVIHYGVTNRWVMLFVLVAIWSLFAFKYLWNRF